MSERGETKMSEQLNNVTAEILLPWDCPGIAVLYGRDGNLDHVEITSLEFLTSNTATIEIAEIAAF